MPKIILEITQQSNNKPLLLLLLLAPYHTS
jgi:hypothetical protein